MMLAPYPFFGLSPETRPHLPETKPSSLTKGQSISQEALTFRMPHLLSYALKLKVNNPRFFFMGQVSRV